MESKIRKASFHCIQNRLATGTEPSTSRSRGTTLPTPPGFWYHLKTKKTGRILWRGVEKKIVVAICCVSSSFKKNFFYFSREQRTNSTFWMFFLVHSLNIPFVFDLQFVMESVKSRIRRLRAHVPKLVWKQKESEMKRIWLVSNSKRQTRGTKFQLYLVLRTESH